MQQVMGMWTFSVCWFKRLGFGSTPPYCLTKELLCMVRAFVLCLGMVLVVLLLSEFGLFWPQRTLLLNFGLA